MKTKLAILFTLTLITLACTKQETNAPSTKTSNASAKAANGKTPVHPSDTAEPESARTDVGDSMPSYSATLLDGKPFSLASEKGNVVFLNVWATWCGPCRFETPELQALHKQYSGSGLKVVGVSVDEGDVEPVKTFVGEQKITYPIAVDPEGRIATLLQTTVLPTSLLIDRDGKIVWRQVGAIMPNDAKLKAAVEKAVAQKRG